MSEPLAAISVDVLAGFAYRLTLAVQVVRPTEKYPALVCFRFLDADGAPLTAPAEPDSARLLVSDIFGDFQYVGKPGKAGLVEVDQVLIPPVGCVRVKVELHRWHAGELRIKGPLRLAPADAQTARAIADARLADRLITAATYDVVAGESYDVFGAFTGSAPLEERGILMAVRFFDSAGVRLDPPGNLPVSELAGAFRYVSPTAVPMVGIASVVAPPGAVRMQLRVLRWKQEADWTLQEMRLVWLGAPGRVAAQGQLDLGTAGAAQALRARITAVGGAGTLLGALHLMFEDAAGAPLLAQGGNLSRSDRFMNHVPIRPPAPHMMAPDGSFVVSRHFTPPDGAARLVWRLLDPEGGWRLEMQNGPVLETFSPDPQRLIATLPEGACWKDPALDPPLREKVQAAVPPSPLWEAVALGQVHLSGGALCAVMPGAWYAASGVLDSPPAQLMICPQYFDAEGALLTEVTGPGCARSGTLPPVRDVVLSGTGAIGPIGFRSCFQAPPEAACGAFYVLASGENPTAPALSDLVMAQVPPQTVCDGMDVSRASVPQLRAAVQLADATGQRVLSRDARRALDMLAPAPAGSEPADLALDLLAPGWLPALIRGTQEPGAQDHLLYLGPREDGALLEELARRGGHPALWLPPVARSHGLPPERGAPDPVPDGVHETQRGGVLMLQTAAAGFDRAAMAPADRVVFDAAYLQRAAQMYGAGLLHARGGVEEMLAACAVAQAQDLPLVCEIAALEHPEAPMLAHLRQTRLFDCLRRADAVLAPAALHSALTAQGVTSHCLVPLEAPHPADSHSAAHSRARSTHMSRKDRI